MVTNDDPFVTSCRCDRASVTVHRQLGGSWMQIAAGKFKAQCLQLMDLVHDTHQRVVITKHGRPVAQLITIERTTPRPVFGRLRGRMESASDLIGPIPDAWRTGGPSPHSRTNRS